MVFLTVGLDGIIRLVFFSLHTWPNTRRTTIELVPYTLFFSISQIKELSRFFRVVALDLKGFNDSDKPQWRKEYKPHIICDELLQFIKSLGSNSVSIIGHDIGAIIGWVRIAFNFCLFVHFFRDFTWYDIAFRKYFNVFFYTMTKLLHACRLINGVH